MRSGFQWDLEGGAFYEARYGFGWDFAYLPELTKYASTILHPRTYASR